MMDLAEFLANHLDIVVKQPTEAGNVFTGSHIATVNQLFFAAICFCDFVFMDIFLAIFFLMDRRPGVCKNNI